jgi:hypothetical protein
MWDFGLLEEHLMACERRIAGKALAVSLEESYWSARFAQMRIFELASTLLRHKVHVINDLRDTFELLLPFRGKSQEFASKRGERVSPSPKTPAKKVVFSDGKSGSPFSQRIHFARPVEWSNDSGRELRRA